MIATIYPYPECNADLISVADAGLLKPYIICSHWRDQKTLGPVVHSPFPYTHSSRDSQNRCVHYLWRHDMNILVAFLAFVRGIQLAITCNRWFSGTNRRVDAPANKIKRQNSALLARGIPTQRASNAESFSLLSDKGGWGWGLEYRFSLLVAGSFSHGRNPICCRSP